VTIVTAQPPRQLPDSLLTIAQVADLVGASVGTLYNQRRTGDGIAALGFSVGRKVRFDPQEVAEYIATSKAADPKYKPEAAK